MSEEKLEILKRNGSDFKGVFSVHNSAALLIELKFLCSKNEINKFK